VDDMIVKSSSCDQHVEDLRQVFQALKAVGMRLIPDKCVFGVEGGKFLGFMLTNRGIEANPDKCQAIMEMQSPKTVKEVQRLVGRVVALSRFMPKMAEKIRPIMSLLKKASWFKWDDQCKDAFLQLKTFLASPPVIQKPRLDQPIIVYLSVSKDAISAALVQEIEGEQRPVYFTSKTLQEAETRYQMIETVALALVITARRMRPYFQNHEVIVRIDYPIAQILSKPDLAGRMITWSIELSEYTIQYEPRGAIKAQVLANFIAEMRQEPSEPDTIQPAWIVYVDGSSNSKGVGAGVVLEGPGDLLIEQSLRFGFKTSNNQAEYEARDMGARDVTCRSDSRLNVGHITGEFQVKDLLLSKYYHKVRTLLQGFSSSKVEHIRREHNARADLLSKLASTKKRSHHKSLVQQTLEAPSVDEKEHACCTLKKEAAWFEPIQQFLLTGQCAEKEERTMRAKSSWFTMVGPVNVGVDYFTKWIEAEPLATITATKVKGFVWKNIVSRFGIPHTIVSDNGRQFIDRTLIAYYEELGIRHVTSSVEHPQTNGQVEAANKIILNELKKRLGTAKRRWPEELLQVLWAYNAIRSAGT